MQLASLIVDALTVVVGLGVIYTAYRNGFLRSIVLVLGYVLSIVAAIYLSKVFSQFLYDQFIRDYIIESIDNTIKMSTGDITIAMVIPVILSRLPDLLLNPILHSFGGETALIEMVDEKTNGVLDNLGEAISDHVVSPVVLSIMQVLLCVMIFILCIIIVKTIAKIFKNVYAIPIVGFINSLLGGALGVVQAGIILYLAAMIVSIIITMTANELSWMNNEVMRSTYVFKYFYRLFG